MNCFRYLDLKSFAEVDRLTLPEYNLLIEAAQLRQIDQEYESHLQAWLNFIVKARKKAGKGYKPVYTKFKQFYDHEKALERLKESKKESKFAGIGKVLNKGV